MTKADIARKYRNEYGMEMPTLKLARIMYAKENLTFRDVEDCRDVLRGIEGKKKTSRYNETHKFPERSKNPYNLPESYQEKREPLRLPLTCNNILLISDLHIPYHDIEAITIALEYGVEHKVNTIFINGDLIDNHKVSRFESDPNKRSVKQEFDATKHFLRALRQIFPSAEIYWLKGNHCYAEGTEVLTERGFIDFRELTAEDKVAEFDNNMNVRFSQPLSILKREYEGPIYDIETGFSRQVVTDGHDVVVGEDKIKAKDLRIDDLKRIPSTGNANNEEYPISDAMLKLLVNVVADGCFVLDKKYGDRKMRVQFKISKERKIANLKEILDEVGYRYSFKICKKSGINKLQPYYIRFYGDPAQEVYNLLGNKKEFPQFFAKLSKRQAELVYDQIMLTDGTEKDNGVFWTTTCKNDIDVIHQMCVLNNLYFISYGAFVNESGFANGKIQYKAKLRKQFSVNWGKSIKVKEYSGFVYCLEMPLGTIVTRYEGKSAFSGNCVRWEKFLLQKVQEIWDDPYFQLEERLRLNEERIHLIDDKVLVKAGKLAITHGHHIFKGIFTPVSPARGAYMKAKQSVIVGHLHRPSHHVESDMENNINAAWSTGCMCQIKMDYSPLVSNSLHGFAHILVEPNGNFTVKNYSIINGKLH
jgi:predicted phosphodiesterase